MATGSGYFYTLLHPEFFETLDRYRPSDEYLAIVKPYLDDRWVLGVGGFWTNVRQREAPLLHEGWKIHVSASVDDGEDVLRRVAPVVIERGVSFKFCSDKRMLALSLTKNWPRTGAGKFITIYPADLDSFKEIIEACYQATRGLVGPYILSDRPYKDSRVVFYRYGEHYSRPVVNAYGVRVPTLISPTGERFTDERAAYFRLPPWVEDPFNPEPPPTPPGEDGVLLHGRYQVKMAIKFSSVGGIYQAFDSVAERDVVIREARPMLARASTGYDAERLLEKEARILRKLSGTGLAPEFIDLFTEWEHSFLVQEKLDAESLWGYAMDFAFADDANPASMFRGIRETAREIINGLRTIHERGIVLRDMTRTNVLFTEEGRVKFIDFEFAYELDGDDPPVAGWTPGYASPDQMNNRLPRVEDDYYALGVLLLDMIAFSAPGYELNRKGVLRSLAMDLEDCRQPAGLLDIIENLTHPEVERRWTAERALEALDSLEAPTDTAPLFPPGTRPPWRPNPQPALKEDVARTIDGVIDYTRALAVYDRHDRLWPASGEIFQTNPVNIQYGAAGTAYLLLRATGEIPERDLAWILDHLRTRRLPPSLFAGAGGVALLLLDAGEEARAREIMEAAADSEALGTLPNLYYGDAGWGLANLGCWARTGDQHFLDEARRTGNSLLERAQEDEERGLFWEADGYVRLGYGEGQAGIATFFFYLYGATGDARYRDAGVRALEFDLSYAVDLPFGVLWFPHTKSGPGDPKSPHMRFGTAGVCPSPRNLVHAD